MFPEAETPACVVVGAGPGLGAALARRFAAGGHRVALLGRDADRLAALSDTLVRDGHEALAVVADAGDDASLTQALHTVSTQWGPPQVLIYNAAHLTPGAPLDLAPDQLRAHAAVDYVGALHAVQILAPAMLRAGHGTMLFTGGGLANQPAAAVTALSVGKAALRALVTCLAEEMTPAGVHAASVTINGTIASGTAFAPDRIAETYWQLHTRPAGQWRPEYPYDGQDAQP